MYFSQKKHFSERGPHWSNKTFILVKKNLYRSLPGTCMSSSGGIGIICWWYSSKRTFILVKKNLFLCPSAACIPSLGGCPLLSRSTLVKKNMFISQQKTFSCVHRGLEPRKMYTFLSMQGPRATVLGAGRHWSARPVPVPGWSCLYGAFRAARPIWWHTIE